MAFYDTTWYCNAGNQSTTGYYAVPLRPQNIAVVVGQLCRPFTAPAVGNERVYVCIIAGTTANTTDASWTFTRANRITDGTATWQECTGVSSMNGDLTNTPTWATVKAGGASLGNIIKRSNGASYQIFSSGGTLGTSEPAFSDTPGAITTETAGTGQWTCLGPVSNFTGGQAPHARLATVFSLSAVPGNTVYVGDNHAESQTTAITVQPTLSQATATKIICHNHSGPYPPVAPTDLAVTATVSTTAVAAISLNLTTGAVYIYGLTFIVGVGQSGSASLNFVVNMAYCLFDACIFKLAATGASSLIALGTSNGGVLTWNNCRVGFAAVAQNIQFGTETFIWQNTATVLAAGSTVPTNLFSQTTGQTSSVILETLDLSQWSAIFASLAAQSAIGSWIVKDCKLNASATFPTPINSGQVIQLVRSDGGATAYKSARYAYEGTETTETSITRVGGASDPTGQAQSRKIVTTGNSQWLRPFKAEPYAIWNPTTGANVTVTVCGTINAGALPNNDDIWLEVEYLGSSASPQGTIINTTKATLLSANAAVASDGSTWNGGGSGAGWSPFKLTTTLSAPQPGMAGYLHARVRAAKPSATFYIDPQITLS